jgi:NodT family efflux transporter outer membrane factor (OMF) lipoprotein
VARFELRPLALGCFAALLSGCGGGLITTVGPDYEAPAPKAPDRWQAPQSEAGAVPHRGDRDAMKRWWKRFDDPVLDRFLLAAEGVSATVADAAARIQAARAGRVSAEAAGLPTLDSKLDANWSEFTFGGPPFQWNRYQIGLQSSWEVDLFGSVARQREAAEGRLQSRQAAWHDARVAVAVEVADAYLNYRYCESLVRIAEADAASRRETARLTDITGRAGLRAPADVALADASAAEGEQVLLRQRAQCELSVKGLVSLTGLSEAEVRRHLSDPPERIAKLPSPPPFRVDSIPAKALAQRPDVAAAERDVAEASANIGVKLAERFPKLNLSGNITPMLQSVNGGSYLQALTWQVGPTLSLPLFDAGKRAADVDAAKARYQAAVSRYRATVRTAVREVEEALVRLRNTDERLPPARAAVAGYGTNFKAMEQLYRAGFGSLIDSESSRRQFLISERAVADLEQERAAAWIALYRAAGGGWDEDKTRSPGPAPAPDEPARAGACCPPVPATTGGKS